MPKLRALRPLYGDYGRVVDGAIFEADEKIAMQLEARGLVERVFPQTKHVARSPEDKAITVFPARENMTAAPPRVGYEPKRAERK